MVLTAVIGAAIVGATGFGGAVGWAVAMDANVAAVTDLDALLPAALYVSFVGFGLLITMVLLVYAVLAWWRLKRAGQATAFQVGTLAKLVWVASGFVGAFVLAFAFGLLRVRGLAMVAPLWAFLLFGVFLPLAIMLLR